MSSRNKPSVLIYCAILVIMLMACNESAEISGTATPETVVMATATGTSTSLPTATSIPTNTPTPTPTLLPSPTFTATPTSTPSPTATSVPPEFTNLILALDYDHVSLEPLSPRDYFPLGVSYIAAVFDYEIHQSAHLDWYIVGASDEIEASGVASFTAGEGTKAFVVRPEMGLDEGSYEFKLELDDKTVLSAQFEVFWNPTLWPITIGETLAGAGQVSNVADRFPARTEYVFASYPTINFQVDDEIFVEWFVNGEKLGEHHYIWDNPEWSSGIHANKIDNQIEAGSALPAGNYEIMVFVNGYPKQCKTFVVFDTSNSTSSDLIEGCETFEELAAASSSDSWGRYEPRSFSELEMLTEEHITDLEEGNIYLEFGPEYQYPSRVQAVFVGDFRDTPETKLFPIQIWMATFAPNLTADEVAEVFGREVLVKEGDVEYWLPVQSSLIPFMEEELSPGDEVKLFVVWMGILAQDGEVERIFLVNEFE